MLATLFAILPLVSPVKDSIPRLDTARVAAVRWQFAADNGFQRKWTPNGNAINLAQELTQTGVYVKQYGPNGLATVSVRGADPQQTQVLWNGIPISNPMHGMADLNTFGMAGISQISLINSSAASFYGSGNVGGALLLSHNAPERNGFATSYSVNPWGLFSGAMDGSIRKNGYYLRATTGMYGGKNQYPVRIPNNSTTAIHKEMNASVVNNMERLILGKEGEKWDLKSIVEYNQAKRGLGSQPQSDKYAGEQWDENMRFMAESKYHVKDFKWNARAAAIKDLIRFRDTNTGEDERTLAKSFHLQSEWSGVYKNMHWLTAADFQAIVAHAPAYNGQKRRNYPAQIAAIQWKEKKWCSAASMRFEWFEKLPVYAASIGRELGQFKLAAAARTSFRRPALNDLFWDRNDHVALKPEKGKEVECTLDWTYKRDAAEIQFQGGAFTRQLSNAIIWIPTGFKWEAVNYFSANYSGIQVRFFGKTKFKKSVFTLIANGETVYSQVKVGNEEKAYERIFVPNVNGSLQAAWTCLSWSFNADMVHTGRRFIATDNSSQLPGFSILNAGMEKKITLHAVEMNVALNASNILGAAYYVMPGKPMPFRGFQITIKLKYIQ